MNDQKYTINGYDVSIYHGDGCWVAELCDPEAVDVISFDALSHQGAYNAVTSFLDHRLREKNNGKK